MNIFDPHISGSLSVSGSGEISGDLRVLGTINATISGTTSNAISASHAAEYTLTSSFHQFTSSYTTGAFTGSFIGDGSGLHSIPASGVVGLNLNKIISGSVSASISPNNGFEVNTNTTVSGHITPSVDNEYDLGSPTHQWRDVYISSGSLYIDGSKVLSSTTQELTITTDNGQSLKILEGTTDSIVLQTADGNIELKSSADGDILIDPTNGKILLKGPVEVLSGQKIQSSVGGTPVVFANDIVVSGSIDLTGTIDGIDLSSFSSSINNLILDIDGDISSLNSFTSSINTTIKSKLDSDGVVSGSSQIILSGTTGFSTVSASLSSLSSSISITNLNQDGRLNSIEGKTGSFATTGSNTFVGSQVISGSVTIRENLIVLGSSSITYTTSSQLRVDDNVIVVNTSNPAERFGGLQVYDSGSVGEATGSLFWDSEKNRWVYQQSSEASYGGGVLMSGPRSSGSLGDELTLTSGKIARSAGGDHLNDSIITEYNAATIGINGNLEITGSIISSVTPLVSGSSQISYIGLTNIPTGIVSGSSQITYSSISSIPSGIVSGSSQITYNSISSIPSGIVSGSSQISYPSLSNIPSGIVSGSSQIDLTATTNYSSGIKTRLNAEGVISGSSQITLTSTQVTNGLGYTPYNSTNPSGYITGISFANVSSKPTTLSGYGITDSLYQDRYSGLNVNAFNGTGLYRGSTDNWTNKPTVVHNGGALLQIDTHPGNYHQQLFFDTGGNRLYMRSADAGTWGSWVTMISTGNIGAQSVNYATTAGSAPNATNVNTNYDVTAGEGNGLRFWNGSDSYKISMGNSSLYTYGTVSDYSIKMQMNDADTGRGFTWGRISYAPIASLNSTSGNMQIAGNFTTAGLTSNGVGVFNSTNDTQISLRSTDAWAGIEFDDSGTPDYIWYNGGNQTFSIGGGGGNVSGKKLHVHGGVTIGSSYTATSVSTNGLTVEGIVRGASSFFAQSGGGFSIRNSGDTGSTGGFSRRGLWEGNSNYDPSLWAETTYGLYFYTNGSATVKTVITPGGSLLHGHTATPAESAWLGTAVIGRDGYNKVIIGSLNSTTTGAYIGGHNSALNAWADINLAGENIIFRYQQTERARIDTSGHFTPGANNSYNFGSTSLRWSNVYTNGLSVSGDATIGGTLTETSSLRYKTNIQTIESGLDKVLQMRGVVYNRKDNGKEEIGVIAEEIGEILPDLVKYNTEGQIDSVSYGRITAVLIEAIKELKQEINDLKNNG